MKTNDNNIKEFMNTKAGTNLLHNIGRIATALEGIAQELLTITDTLRSIKNIGNSLLSK